LKLPLTATVSAAGLNLPERISISILHAQLTQMFFGCPMPKPAKSRTREKQTKVFITPPLRFIERYKSPHY
jgi:hypothetical protein